MNGRASVFGDIDAAGSGSGSGSGAGEGGVVPPVDGKGIISEVGIVVDVSVDGRS